MGLKEDTLQLADDLRAMAVNDLSAIAIEDLQIKKKFGRVEYGVKESTQQEAIDAAKVLVNDAKGGSTEFILVNTFAAFKENQWMAVVFGGWVTPAE